MHRQGDFTFDLTAFSKCKQRTNAVQSCGLKLQKQKENE